MNNYLNILTKTTYKPNLAQNRHLGVKLAFKGSWYERHLEFISPGFDYNS